MRPNILSIAAFIPWAGFTWLGVSVLTSVGEQHASGFPNEGQITFYAGIPSVFCALTLIGLLLSFRYPKSWPILLANILFLLALFPYLFGYTGGV